MATLLRKELRALRPWFLFCAVLGLASVLGQAMTEPGAVSLGASFEALIGQTTTLILAVVALALGVGLAAKERDDATLAFLDALPVTRTHVFFAKVLAALGVPLTLATLLFAEALVNHHFARGSLDAPFHPPILVGAFLMQAQLAATFLAVGTLLGFARSVAWLLVGVLASGLQWLVREVPRAALLDPLRLVEAGVEGLRWRYDVEAVAAQGALALGCLLLAWALFVRAGRGRAVTVSPRPVVSALVGLATVASLLVALGLWGRSGAAGEGGAAEPDVEALPRSAPGTTTTARYVFSYPGLEARRAQQLADRADAIFETVSSLLGAPDAGAPIFVDLSGSLENTLGTAYEDRLRMRLDETPEATLAHETAHVLARRLTGPEGGVRWSAARVLDEGLASWVEGRLRPHPAEDELVLAALRERHELELSDLVDFDRFTAVQDDDLKYVIGRGLIEAMVRRAGAGSIPRLLSAFGDARLSPKLTGAALWQATFQLAGMDVGLFTDDFFAAVERTRLERRAELNALPRPEVRLVSFDENYGVEARLPDAVAGASVVLRFRPGPDSPVDAYERVWVPSGHIAWRDPSTLQGRRVCFQAGVPLSERSVLFEPWGCLPLAAAAPWTPPDEAPGADAPADGATPAAPP
ncbi:MAG: ABC transporter permease subunit [Myxococcaceae bacterium]|jgi:hypothetical protein|nr:ABC transporter permease subunit [Myxococcaceae bacterium]MCA3016658.1 ABC transporter permease subunit [Myxococcaceae bacterium]